VLGSYIYFVWLDKCWTSLRNTVYSTFHKTRPFKYVIRERVFFLSTTKIRTNWTHCVKFDYSSFHSTATCFGISAVILRGCTKVLMLAGSMFYIHMLHSSSVEWHIRPMCHSIEDDSWNVETCRGSLKTIITKLDTVRFVGSYFSDWWHNNTRS
jgi:hypothetical protein